MLNLQLYIDGTIIGSPHFVGEKRDVKSLGAAAGRPQPLANECNERRNRAESNS